MTSFQSVIAGQQVIDRERTFEGLVQEYKNRIHSYVCRMTRDSADAEDITQEVFIRAYQSMSAFRYDAAVDTWLYRIATNLVIDRFRRGQRAPKTVTPEGEATFLELPTTSREDDPHASLQLGELQAQVQKAVHSLPTKLRAVVILHDMEGLSYEQVAETVGCPLGTVKSRLFNARLLLKRKLQYYMESEG